MNRPDILIASVRAALIGPEFLGHERRRELAALLERVVGGEPLELLRAACEWDESLDRDADPEDKIEPEWRSMARELLGATEGAA